MRRHDHGLEPATLNASDRVQPTRMQRYHGRHARRRQSRLSAELPVLVLTAFVLAVLVKGLAYRLGEPQHGQVVVFVRETADKPPADQGPMSWVRRAVAQGLGGTPPGSEDLIKRVVGLPGDIVEGRNGRLWRNGRPVVESYLPPRTFTSDFGPIRVQPGHYWMMGDNREDSADSRYFGQVPRSALVGRAFVKVWPVTHVGGL